MNKFETLEDNQLQQISGGGIMYYVGKGVYLLCEGWTHVWG